MHQKIPQDFERGERGEKKRGRDYASGSTLGRVSPGLPSMAGGERAREGVACWRGLHLKRILKGTVDFNIQSQIL